MTHSCWKWERREGQTEKNLVEYCGGGGRTRVGLYGDCWAIVSLQFRIELIFGDLWFKTCR